MMIRTLIATLLLAGGALAADVTGKWVASVQGRDGNAREVVYNLKAEGDKLTGTASGFRGQEVQITDGKIEGDKISFTTKMEFNGNTMVMTYKGAVAGDELKMTQQREGGDNAREIVAKRSK